MPDRPDLTPVDDELAAIAEALIADAPAAPDWPLATDTTERDVAKASVVEVSVVEIGAALRPKRLPRKHTATVAAAAIFAVAGLLVATVGTRTSQVPNQRGQIVAQPERDDATGRATPAPSSPSVPQPAPTSESSIRPGAEPSPRGDAFASLPPLPRVEAGSGPIAGYPRVAIAKTIAGQDGTSPERREIFVYDRPLGQQRRLGPLDDGRLAHPTDDGSPLVLPVVGDAGAEWLQVIVDGSRGSHSVWVAAADFDVHYLDRTLLVDLMNPLDPRLRVIRSGSLLLDEPILESVDLSIFQPLTAGYVARGWVDDGAVAEIELTDSSSSGTATQLLIRSTDPQNPPNPPMLTRTLSVTPQVLRELSTMVVPGTPFFIRTDDELRLSSYEPASTIPVDTDLPSPSSRAFDPTARTSLWGTCVNEQGATTFCLDRSSPVVDETVIGSAFLVAREGAGVPVRARSTSSSAPNQSSERDRTSIVRGPTGAPIPEQTRLIEVFDSPGGEPRMLVYDNSVDGREFVFPLANPTVFDQPLVLRIVRGLPGDEWIQVQAPSRPLRRTVFVRASDFVFATTTASVEIDARVDGELTLFNRAMPVLSSPMVSARSVRPHSFHDTLVDQVLDATMLGPAYGNWVATHNTWSEVMGSFGGGLPGQSLHGTDAPELMNEAVTSGGVRVTNEVMQQLVDIDASHSLEDHSALLGAPLLIYHAERSPADDLVAEPWLPARTVPFDHDIDALPLPVYS